ESLVILIIDDDEVPTENIDLTIVPRPI
ncbi:MAG: hypothetical protein ACI9FB_004345, partial [Candidatus Azotimanducaceae bacterium]